MIGSSHDDTVVVQGSGTVEGGLGADTFSFLGEVDAATIEDFDSAEGDAISLSSAGFQHVTRSDVQAMLDGSVGNVLDLTLLGDAGSYEHGPFTLGRGVRVSDLTVNDFILDGEIDPDPDLATYDEIAYQLTDGFWEDDTGRHSFTVATGGTLTADITALTAEQQQLARWALESWTNVTGIEFRFVAGDADITFDHDVEPGTYASSGPTSLRGGEILPPRCDARRGVDGDGDGR